MKVGLQPSQGSGLVEIINDPDKNGVFKITDKDTQKFVVVITDGTQTTTQEFDLSGLELEAEPEPPSEWIEHQLDEFSIDNDGSPLTKGILAYPKGTILDEVRLEFESTDVLDEEVAPLTSFGTSYGCGTSENDVHLNGGPLMCERDSIDDTYFNVSVDALETNVTEDRQYACIGLTVSHGPDNERIIFNDFSKVTLKYKLK